MSEFTRKELLRYAKQSIRRRRPHAHRWPGDTRSMLLEILVDWVEIQEEATALHSASAQPEPDSSDSE